MTAPTDHQRLNQTLDAYLDGELEPNMHRQLEIHLEACARCRLDLVQLKQTRAALRGLPALTAPRSFAVTAPPAPNRTRGYPRWLAGWLPWVWRLGPVAAAACLVLALAGPGTSNHAPTATLSSREDQPAFSAPLADRSASQRLAPLATPAPGGSVAGAAAPAAPASSDSSAPEAARSAGAAPPAADALGPVAVAPSKASAEHVGASGEAALPAETRRIADTRNALIAAAAVLAAISAAALGADWRYRALRARLP
jgi:hypothetical protein